MCNYLSFVSADVLIIKHILKRDIILHDCKRNLKMKQFFKSIYLLYSTILVLLTLYSYTCTTAQGTD